MFLSLLFFFKAPNGLEKKMKVNLSSAIAEAPRPQTNKAIFYMTGKTCVRAQVENRVQTERVGAKETSKKPPRPKGQVWPLNTYNL